MKLKLLAAAGLLSLAGVAYAHRLDEYLQATLLTVDKTHVQASMRLVPGIAVASSIIASIDTNGDGVLSAAEQQAYAQRVLNDLSLRIDGHALTPRLVSANFPSIDQMREGLGEINIEFAADLPRGGRNRRFILEDHHQRQNSAYLVNSLVPTDPDIRIVSQTRNELQSFYQLDYVQSVVAATTSQHWSADLSDWIAAHLQGLGATGFTSLFHLGMRHIAEGTDHLLFLLALLLPAPLLAVGSRWSGPAHVRGGLTRILKIVTAFTVGHSITLALAALGFVHVSSHPIEVLIAVSILVSAIHALRPLFPGKEAAIAGFFGLIHGLAFAATLSQLGLGTWQRVSGILAFNLGIETMQLVVVAVTLPSLLLLSRTPAYPAFRIGGALFAAMASIGWIADRLFGTHSPVDAIVNALAHYAAGLAALLFAGSLLCWRLFQFQSSRANNLPGRSQNQRSMVQSQVAPENS